MESPRRWTKKEAWWAGYREGKGLPPDMPCQEALEAPRLAQQPEEFELIVRETMNRADITIIPGFDAEARCAQRLKDAHEALKQAAGAASASEYGNQFLGALDEAIRGVECVRGMLA